MKTSLKTSFLILLGVGALAWLPTGCTQVSSGSSEYSHDSSITEKVMDQLERDDDLRVAGLKAETSQGIVTLSGTVDSNDKKDRASRLAAGALGVEGVKNAITVVK